MRGGAHARPGTLARRRRVAREEVEDAEADATHDGRALGRPRRGARVVDELDELRALGKVRTEAFDVISERGRAEREDEIVPGEELHDPLAHRGQEAGEERMVFGEAAPARHRADPHGRVVPLGEAHDLVPGAIAVDGGAHDECGALRAVERIADRGQHTRFGPQLGAHRARFDACAGLGPIVCRNGDEHRPARRLHREVVGARDGGRNVLGARRLAAPLHVRLRQLGRLGRIQEGLVGKDGARLLACGDDERRAIPVCGEDVAHRVSHAYRGVQVHEGGVARCLRVAVGHAHDDRLLQAEDVAEVRREIPEQRQLGRPRVAEDRRDPEGAQQVEDGGSDGHEANDIDQFARSQRLLTPWFI